MTTINEQITRLSENESRVDLFTNGAANQDVLTRFGTTYPSLQKLISNIYDQTGYLVPVAYTGGISLTAPNQIVEYNGDNYAPILTQLPFTTSGAFENAKFRVIQGVLRGELAAPSGSSLVGYLPAGTGAVAMDVQSKLRESISVADKGANGVDYDTYEIAAASMSDYATVHGTHLVSFSNLSGYPVKGLIGASHSAELNNPNTEQSTLAIGSTDYQRPIRTRVSNLSITGSNADTTNNYPDLSAWSSFSHYTSNYIHDVSSGVNIGYLGEDSLGATAAFGGTIAQFASNTPVLQPLRASSGVTLAFNNVVNANIIGYQIFCTNHTRVIGNSVVNSAPSSQHGFRFTGYPGGPTNFNTASANTTKNVQNGISIQTATKYNSLNGFVSETPTVAGVSFNTNDAYANYHHAFNFVQAISNGGTHGVYAAKPQYNHIQHIVDGASTWGVHFDASGTYGLNSCNILDAVVANSTEGAYINSSGNHVRVVLSQLNGRGISIAGSNNIVDVVCDTPSKTTSTVALQISGSNNQVRIASYGNANTSDISVSGSKNYIQLQAAKSISVIGNDNTFVGYVNNVGSTNIANAGLRNDFNGIKGVSGMFYASGTTHVTTGEVTVTGLDRPQGGAGITYYAIASLTGTGFAGKAVHFKNTTSSNSFNFIVYNADGSLATSLAVTLVIQYGHIVQP